MAMGFQIEVFFFFLPWRCYSAYRLISPVSVDVQRKISKYKKKKNNTVKPVLPFILNTDWE